MSTIIKTIETFLVFLLKPTCGQGIGLEEISPLPSYAVRLSLFFLFQKQIGPVRRLFSRYGLEG